MAEIHTLAVGQVVYSKCGRDKGLPFVVVGLDGEYAEIVDGCVRRLEKPKKKKLRHLQPVKYIDGELRDRITAGVGMALTDADFRKALEPYQNKKQ